MEDAAARAVAADGADDDDSDSDDSDDASSSDSDAELDMPDESTMDRIMKLERVVANTPARYNAHVALIRELRAAKLRERARRAREAFAGSFALNENQWREWIADEVADAKGKKNARGEIVGPLFERAVTDVPGAVTLWLGYFEFSMDQDWESERRRALYERALESAGADFRDGPKLFAARRAFETSRHAVDGDARTKVASRVRDLFRRQLALPHARIAETARQAEAWEAEQKETETSPPASEPEPVLTPAARAAHAVAVAVAERRRPLEEAVAAAEALPCGDDRAGTPSAEASAGEADEKRRRRRRAAREARADALAAAHRAFVAAEEAAFETDAGSASVPDVRVRLATLASAYERALAASPTDEALWRRFTARLERSATGRAASEAHARAVRHCPGSGETFACALRWRCALGDAEGAHAELASVESRFGDSPRDAHAALAAAARSGLIAPEEALRRLGDVSPTATDGENDPQGWIDPDLTLLRQTVRRSRDLTDRVRIWDAFAETSAFKNIAEVHVARATFLADALGDDDAAAAAFKKAFAKIDALTSASGTTCSTKRTSASAKGSLESPGALVLCRAWMAFERSRGAGADGSRDFREKQSESLSRSFLEADARAGARLRAVEAARAARAAKAADPEEAKRLRRANDPNYVEKGEKDVRDDGWNVRRKRRLGGETPADVGEGPATKKPRRRTSDRRTAIEEGDGGKTEPGAAAETETDDDRSGGPDVDSADKSAFRLPLDPEARAAKYKELFPERDSRTAFVRNVPFQCTERELERFFEDAGVAGVLEERGRVTARVVMDKATGKPRGFAYVEFASEKALRAAVMRDGEAFKGRKLSIAVSLPPGKEKPGGGAKAQKVQKPDPGPARRAPRGLGFGGGMTPRAARPAVAAGGGDAERPKSNADFRAELLKGFRKSEGV